MMKFGKLTCLLLALGPGIQLVWSADDPAIRQLADQARYWQQNAREDLAASAWQKLLRADANHPEALIRLGIHEAHAGNSAQALALYQRALKLPSPPPGVADLETALRAMKNAPVIDTARKQAQAGQAKAAASSYQTALGTSKPTGQLGLEYYQTLGATPQGWEEARRGLEGLVRNEPGNQRYALALARHLTYRESTRRQGISQLASLSQQDQVKQEARTGWRQALEWLNARKTDRALYSAYLARYPDDQAIRERLARIDPPKAAPKKMVPESRSRIQPTVATKNVVKKVTPEIQIEARASAKKDVQKATPELGFRLLAEGQIEAAEESFQTVLAKNPRNADAMGGLGTIRLRQQAFKEAVRLLDHAMQVDRRHASRWTEARDTAYYWTLMQQVLQARKDGKLLEVEKVLLEATKLDAKQPLGQVLLGDLWVAKRQFPKAESFYRSALKSPDPDPGAFRGLISVLMETGREREAMTMLSALDDAAALKVEGIGQLKAGVMLKLADADERAKAYQAAADKLEAALALDLSNAWVRLALARQYQRLGDLPRANFLLDALLKIKPDSVEALHARALLYAEQKLWQDALSTLERIPAAVRSEKIIEDQRRMSVNLQVQRAQQLMAQGNRQQARALLSQAEVGVGQDFALLALVAGAWSTAGQATEALGMMREALIRAPSDNVDLRLQYAGMLLDAGQEAELTRTLGALAEARSLTVSQKEDLNKIIIALTVRQADALREAGRVGDAYSIVYRALEQSDDPRLLMALARIYNTAGEPQKALAMAERVIAREPNDLEHRLFASGIALGAKARERAAVHASAALVIAPNDPRSFTAAGRAERELGDLDKSLAYFQRAQALELSRVTGFRGPGNLEASAAIDFASRDRLFADPNRQRSGILPIPQAREASINSALPPFAMQPTFQLPVLPAVQSVVQPTVQPPMQFATQPTVQPAVLAALAQGKERELTVGEEINAIKLKLSSTLDLSARWRMRSGESGMGSLNELEIPIELTTPLGSDGAFTLRLTPTLLSAGSLNRTEAGNTAKFGSSALGLLLNNFDSGPLQEASGVAVSVGYRDENLTLNIGTTPLGFLVNHLVGDLGFSTKLDSLTLRGGLSRRAVTDSMLSYAGTRDPRTQEVWGGVVKTGGTIGLTYGGDEGGVYIDLGAASLDGKGVKDNIEVEASMGAYWRVYQVSDSKLKLGLNFTALGYRENLGFFTLGHGGYFSPQQYFSLGVPFEFAGRRRGFSYQLGGELSVRRFSQDRAPYFPMDSNFQGAWTTKAGTTYQSYYDAESSSGMGYNLFGLFEYQFTPKFALGGRLGFDNSRNYAQQSGMLYLRYAFDGLEQFLPFSSRASVAHIP